MADISGIAHIQLSVRDMQRSVPFYSTLLKAMVMKPVLEDHSFHYCDGGRTGVAVQRSARIIREPQESDFAPGYHSILFDDPDGIRIEVNFVPGKELLSE